MSKLARMALMAVVLISAGCSSMSMGEMATTSYGDMAQQGQDSLYRGGSL